MQHEDNEIETIARGNLDAFFADLRAEAGQTDLTKNARETREAEEVDHDWHTFTENLEFAAATGRTGAAPRLRSERPAPDEPMWRPGMDPGFGLEKSANRRKNSLRAWFASELASGKTARDLIEYAQRGGDSETANALQELANELGE
jgi:hypothetical protein